MSDDPIGKRTGMSGIPKARTDEYGRIDCPRCGRRLDHKIMIGQRIYAWGKHFRIVEIRGNRALIVPIDSQGKPLRKPSWADWCPLTVVSRYLPPTPERVAWEAKHTAR